MAQIQLDGFLADSVTASEGKLYALGAGWNRIFVSLFPARHDRIAIGLLFRLPAGSAHESRRFELRILGPSDEEIALGAGPEGPVDRIAGEFTAGADEEQIVPMALNLNGLTLARPGAYRVIVSVNGDDVKTLGFQVQALAAQLRQQPPSSATGTSGYL